MTEEQMIAVRQGRHEVRAALGRAASKLAGRTGLTQDQQVEKLDKSIRQLNAALSALTATRELAATRDFAAHQKAKGRYVEAPAADTDALDLDAVDDLEDEDA